MERRATLYAGLSAFEGTLVALWQRRRCRCSSLRDGKKGQEMGLCKPKRAVDEPLVQTSVRCLQGVLDTVLDGFGPFFGGPILRGGGGFPRLAQRPLLRRKKLAGVLVDTKTQASELEMAVVGVGLNLNQALEDFPEDLRPVATSLWLAKDRTFSKQAVLKAFLRELVNLWGFIEQEGDGAFLEAYWQAACGQTSKFAFVVSGQRARAIGLEQSGGLCLEMEDGSVLVARDVGDIVKTTPERQDASYS